jgi:hypothetical protein
MNKLFICFCCLWMGGSARVFAQINLQHPEQFYTNGMQIDGWTRNDAEHLSSTFWLVKNPADSLSYQQQLVIVYDSKPNDLYYYDVVSELFIGRYKMDTGEYSLLAKSDRRRRLEDIPGSKFPPAGARPRVSEMVEPLSNGVPNNQRLMEAPPTMKFPRLRTSAWEGFYTDVGANQRRRMVLTLDGGQGRYRALDVAVNGELRNVQYRTRDGMHVISGIWDAGSVGGGFEFRVTMKDLSVFQGDYWVGNNRRRTFIWDGKRTSR